MSEREQGFRAGLEAAAAHVEQYPSPLDDLPMALAMRALAEGIRAIQPAATLTSQAAEIARMREALEPLAREADHWPKDTPDNTPLTVAPVTEDGWDYEFTLGELRRARAALNGESHD